MTTRKPEAWEGVSPLGAVDYNSVTVMAFLAEQFPDEDPATLFAREAYARRFNCWIQDQETGKHHSIEHHHWFHATVDGVKKSKDSPYFEWDPKTGWGRLFPQPDRDGRFIGGGARLRGPTAVAAGYVFANRAEVDNLLPESLPDMTDQGAADEPPAQSEGAEATVEQIHIGNLSFAREPKKALKDWLGQKGLSGGADHKHDYLDLNRRLDGFQSKFGDEYLFKKLGSIASIAKTLRANLEEDGAQVPVDSVLRDFVTAWAHDKALSAKSAVK